jgi:hypothetical protein
MVMADNIAKVNKMMRKSFGKTEIDKRDKLGC